MLINKFLYVQKKLHQFLFQKIFNKYEKENFDVEFDMFKSKHVCMTNSLYLYMINSLNITWKIWPKKICIILRNSKQKVIVKFPEFWKNCIQVQKFPNTQNILSIITLTSKYNINISQTSY